MKKILILAANPRQDLDLRHEIHILKNVIERSDEGDRFEVKIDSAVRPQNLQKLFLKHKPRLVHFCGHGTGEQGLVLEDDRGKEQLVSTSAISDLFKNFSNKVECVFLNACYSEKQTEAIKEHINYTIGISQAIRDDAAIIFARGFYQALAYGKSIPEAFELSCNAIELQIYDTMTSRSGISKQERKFIAEDEFGLVSLSKSFKPALKIKSPLTPFPEEKISANLTPFPDLSKGIQEEIARKRYREYLQGDCGLGRNSLARRINQQEYRWRQVLIDKVNNFWIKGVLKKSLFHQVSFEQTITNRSDALDRPFSGLEEFGVESDLSFDFIQKSTSDIFDEMGTGRTLLILGEPGTGKTVSLLKLAERLIKRTEQDLSSPIPVIFNLSSWSSKRQPIAEWLVTELKEKYQVSKALSKTWIEQEELILLLDGLDEVKAEYRNDCVKALNKFIENHGITEMVVCSRARDYEALSERLKLRSAICIQPLTSEYIDWYLEDVGNPLEGLKTLLQRDRELEEFAKTPLIFSVMSITYQGYSLEALLQEMSVKERRYTRLFDSYIERMFQRKQITQQYSHNLTKRWLIWLAKRMIQESQSIFLIEKIQSTWLSNPTQINIKRLISWSYLLKYFQKPMYLVGLPLILGLCGIISGLIVGLVSGLSSQSNSLLQYGIIGGLVGGIGGSIFGLILGSIEKIELAERLKFSSTNFRKGLNKALNYGVIFGLLGGMVGGMVGGMGKLFGGPSIGVINGAFRGLSGGLIGGFIDGLLRGLSIEIEIEDKIVPNQGIITSAFNALTYGLSGGIISGLFVGLIFELRIGLIFGLIFGLTGGLVGPAGRACIQHLTLRIVLHLTGYIPWNYARFLDHAKELIFMQKVGGGYIFINRMLMEHFAQMKLN